MSRKTSIAAVLLAASLGSPSLQAIAQVPPSASELAQYTGLFRAIATGNKAEATKLIALGQDLELRDSQGRTAFLVAAHLGNVEIMRQLAKAGADVNNLDEQQYDAVTIASVADDMSVLNAAIVLGNKATNITSPYRGTALIAAAHLGHDQVVRALIAAGAPLDHVNNLGWTALIEAVVLGDGGARHQATVKALVQAGANKAIAEKSGKTPLQLAEQRDYREIVDLLK